MPPHTYPPFVGFAMNAKNTGEATAVATPERQPAISAINYRHITPAASVTRLPAPLRPERALRPARQPVLAACLQCRRRKVKVGNEVLIRQCGQKSKKILLLLVSPIRSSLPPDSDRSAIALVFGLDSEDVGQGRLGRYQMIHTLRHRTFRLPFPVIPTSLSPSPVAPFEKWSFFPLTTFVFQSVLALVQPASDAPFTRKDAHGIPNLTRRVLNRFEDDTKTSRRRTKTCVNF